MSETPKKTWLVIVAKLFRWIFLIIGSVATFTAGEFLLRRFTENTGVADKVPYIMVNLIAIVFCLWLLSPILRRLFPSIFRLTKLFYHYFFTWQTLRRTLVALAVLATLIAIFYIEEDWRGKRAWENCKRELEAQGVVLDWNQFIPPPVPDDQNFFKAPKMTDWFVTSFSTNGLYEGTWNKTNGLGRDLNAAYPDNSVPKDVVIVAEISCAQSNSTENTLHFGDPAAAKQVRELIEQAVGPSVMGAQGLVLTGKKWDQIRPLKIHLQTDKMPSDNEFADWLDLGVITTDTRHLRMEYKTYVNASDISTFRVLLDPMNSISAEDYLARSAQAASDMDLIREALKRPYARMDGDYSQPTETEIPISNFIAVRALAQTLDQQAKCYLLLGRPEKALPDVLLIRQMCQILDGSPTGKPVLLVSSMINVAVTGLYANTIAYGMQTHAWQEPQLAALQEQLKGINLSSTVLESFKDEIAWTRRIGETAPLPTWSSLRFFSWPVPRGWLYQNMAVAAKLDYKSQAGFDPVNSTISPQIMGTSMDMVKRTVQNRSPFYILARIAVPNFFKAWQTTAYNQTLINEAQIACALERYRLAHGEYPETLDALVPQFMEAIPHDIIGGQPLHYRRTDDGKFLLYSVGWNEMDDGGQPSPQKGGIDYTKGDWVWPVAEE